MVAGASGGNLYFFNCLFIYLFIIIVCVVMCYFQLCGENYHWQWRSFMVAGASGG